jgi:hypothetical protein
MGTKDVMKQQLQSRVFLTNADRKVITILGLSQENSDALTEAGFHPGNEIIVVLHRHKYDVQIRNIARLTAIDVEDKKRLQLRISASGTAEILERGFQDLEDVTIDILGLNELNWQEVVNSG